MSFLKKIWKQRIVEYPGRRRLDDTSQPEVYDVSRAEGNVMQEGDGFTAANMNDLEERIEAGIEDMSPKEETISTFPIPGTPGVFYVDIETNLIYRWDETVEEYVQVGGGKNEAEGMISDAFSELKDYASGDYAIYNNTLYRFTSAKPAGAWDAGAVEATTVAGELSELNGNLILDYANAVTLPIKNNISATISTKGMLFPYNFRYSGEGSPYANIHINNSHIAIVNFNSAGREMPGPFPVSPGDIVKITISGGSAEHMVSDWKLVPCKNNN